MKEQGRTHEALAPKLEVEPASMRSSGRCGCCGKVRRTAWGYVFSDGGPRACYFVEWTVGHMSGARIDVVVGDWNDGTTEQDRDAVSFECQLRTPRGGAPELVIADAAGRPAAEVGRARAHDVAGTPLAAEARAIADAVLARDGRLAELGPRAGA